MKRTLISICLLASCICGTAEPIRMTMAQCIDSALANNLSLQTQVNRYESSRIQYQQSLTNISPSIYGSAGQNWGFGRSTGADNVITSRNSASTSFNLGAQLILFDGLAMKFAIDQARASMQQSEAELNTYEQQIRISVASLYLQVLLQKELLAVADSQLLDTRRMLHRDSLLIAANRLAAGEIYTIQAQEAQNELAVVQYRNAVQLALLDLAQAMNLASYESFDIVTIPADELITELLPERELVYESALQNRAEIRSLEYSIAAAEAALKRQKAAYSPTISANAGVGTSYYKMYGIDNAAFADQMKNNAQASVGLSLNVPIYDKMQTPHAVKQQKLNLENAKISLDQKKQDIRKEIDKAYYDAVNAHSELESAHRAERSQQQALTYAEQKYEAGRGNSFEYTTAKTNYLRAVSSRLQAEYTYYFRLRILYYYQGLK